MVATADSSPREKLSPIERAFARSHGQLPDRSPNFALVARIRGSFGDDELRRALERVRVRHPRLVTRLAAGEEGEPYWTGEGVPDFPLRVLESLPQDAWIKLVEAELLVPFRRDTGPCARFVLLRREGEDDLVVVCDHGSCDGMSGAFLLRDVLTLLGDPEHEPEPLAFPANALECLPASVVGSRRLRWKARALTTLFVLGQRLPPKRLPAAARPAAGRSQADPAAARICLLPSGLDTDETEALVERCRIERVTVQAALCAAWLLAFAETLPESESRIRRVSIPISIRKQLAPPPVETAGMFLSGCELDADCSPSRGLWQVARELTAKLKHAREDRRLLFGPLMLRTLLPRLRPDEAAAAIFRFILPPPDYDFSITNVGRLDVPLRIGSLRVEAMHGPLVNTSPLEHTVGICTVGGRLSMSFLFRESLLAPADGQRLLEDVLARVRRAVSTAD